MKNLPSRSFLILIFALLGVLVILGCSSQLDYLMESISPSKLMVFDKKRDDHIELALVLSGGAARGLSHIGVLKVLEEENIPVDIVVGTSMGSIIGAMYAAGMDTTQIETFSRTAIENSFGMFDLAMFSPKKFGLLDFSPFQNELYKQMPYKMIEDFPLRFAAVATDLNTGEQVVFNSGPAITALSASSAAPGVFTPIEYNGHWLVDGGLVNNLPADVARSMGADMVIAVNVIRKPGNFELDSYYDILAGSLHVIFNNTGKLNEPLADIVISPQVNGVHAMDFRNHNLDFLIEAGEEATRLSLPAIRQKLEELKAKSSSLIY